VSVPVDDAPGSAAIREAVTRLCDAKRLHAPGTLTAIVAALVGNPYDAAEAIQALEKESIRRELRRDEVRTALASLSADRLLPDAPPTVGKLLATLFEAEDPVPVDDLAERAGVSQRSVSRHLDALQALDVVRNTDDGLRMALPFDSREHDVDLPAAARDRLTTASDVAWWVAEVVLEGDPPQGCSRRSPAIGLLPFGRSTSCSRGSMLRRH